ncbi:MAG TPA: TIGR03435 family protein [Acidobacteriaceae bacterium]|jgi:uncharacterized protein (TIGR03435 family)
MNFSKKKIGVRFRLLLLGTAIACGHAQFKPSSITNTPPAGISYDVVLIKPGSPNAQAMEISRNETSLTVRNGSIKQLIMNAFGIREDLIEGLPRWAIESRYDVQAKVADPDIHRLSLLTEDQRRAMVAEILRQRFHLELHITRKVMLTYDLVIAGGPKKFNEVSVENIRDISNGLSRGGMLTNDGELTAHAVPMASLAFALSDELGREVVDKTNMHGSYDLQLKWTPDRESSAADKEFPSIFRAIQEQLGLKLVPSKSPVAVLVIDHLEAPNMD